MKKFMFLSVAVMLILAACSPNPEPEPEGISLSESQIEVTDEGGIFPLTVTCSEAWTADKESGGDWVMLSQTSGEGTTEIKVVANPGSGYAIAYFYFVSGEYKTLLTVVRRGNSPIVLSTYKIEVPNIGGEYEIEVTSKVKWMTKKNVSWLTVTPGMGSNNGKINLTVDPTDSYAETTTELTVSVVADDTQEPAVIEIVRDPITIGTFAVSETESIIFAPGNLQYQASTGAYRFAPHQYDVIGVDNKYISSWNSDWIDLLGWGTSGYKNQEPYMTSTDVADYYSGSGTPEAEYDWGYMHVIHRVDEVGEEDAGYWRTPTIMEIAAIIAEKYKSGMAGGVNIKDPSLSSAIPGLVVMPDGVELPEGFKLIPMTMTDYTYKEFLQIQAMGALFLPIATCYRKGTEIVQLHGKYWTASYDGSGKAYSFNANSGSTGPDEIYYGYAVRLVHTLEEGSE